MKKIHQSTLLRDFIGAAFCLVTAFVLVLMCTGCGDDLAGGTAEETNIVASLSNITVLGRVKNINEILEANNVDADSEKMIARMLPRSPTSSPSSLDKSPFAQEPALFAGSISFGGKYGISDKSVFIWPFII